MLRSVRSYGSFRMFALRIEQRPGTRVVASKLLSLSEVRSASTWENAWGCVIVPRLTDAEKALCGSVQKVLVNSGEFKGYEFETSDVVASLLDMGVTSVLFIVNEPSRGEERTAPISELLMSQPLLSALPTHTDDGHPATVALYEKVRDKLVADGVRGVLNATHAKGAMLDLTKLLYALSTFHENLLARSAPVPGYFNYSKGANDYAEKKQQICNCFIIAKKTTRDFI